MELQKLCITILVNGEKLTYHFSPMETVRNSHFSLTARFSKESNGTSYWADIIPEDILQLEEAYYEIEYDFRENDRIFCNGYQSWSESREMRLDEKQPGLNPLTWPINKFHQLYPYGDYHFADYLNRPGQFHGYTYSYIRNGQQYKLFGSLSEKSGFTVFRHDAVKGNIRIEKDCRGTVVKTPFRLFTLFIAEGEETAVFPNYFQKMETPDTLQKDLTGWTSWYNYYTAITEEIIHENLRAFASRKIPIDIFQIDDGWQPAVGDWLNANHKFPGGMKALAENIQFSGYKAGLWLAPFICEEDSSVMRNHPDWIRRDSKGRPVVAGRSAGWSGRFYALDLQNKNVNDYLRKVFDTVLNEWGYDMVKLDFLYAAALLPPAGENRGQAMDTAMTFLRKAVGDKWMLGCGVPLGSAWGKCDFCRISGDVALKWEEKILSDVIRYRERVSTLGALNSTISRRHQHRGGYINDPDVYFLRDDNIKMSTEQRNTLYMLNLLMGGLLFTSDKIDAYNEIQMQQYLSQFPLWQRTIHSVEEKEGVFQIEMKSRERDYLILANLSAKPSTVELPAGIYFVDGKIQQDQLDLDAYQTRCLLNCDVADFEIVGTTGHVFPLMNLESFTIAKSAGKVDLKKAANSVLPAVAYIKVPEDCAGLMFNEEEYPALRLDAFFLVKIPF